MKKIILIVSITVFSIGAYSQSCGYDSSGVCGGSGVLATIGGGGDTSTTTSYPDPFGNYYTSALQVYLYRVSELNAAGITGPCKIDGISFYVTDTAGITNYHEFTINMGCTSDTSLPNTNIFGIQQFFTVFPSSNHHVSIGWNTFPFTIAFYWDGISSLLVENCFNQGPPFANYRYNCRTVNTPTSYCSAQASPSDASDQCLTSPGFTLSFNKHPLIQFNHCNSTMGINAITNENYISISPNPFTSQTTISFSSEQKNTEIRITDIVGKEIKKISHVQDRQVVIDKGDMKEGIYFVQTTDEQKHICNRKIVIQ